MRDEFSQHHMDGETAELSAAVREKASELYDMLEQLIPTSRECSLAKTKLEECVMWANKALALYDCWGK